MPQGGAGKARKKSMALKSLIRGKKAPKSKMPTGMAKPKKMPMGMMKSKKMY